MPSPPLPSFNHNTHGRDPLHRHPLHGHNPWNDDPGDPDEGDIQSVRWSSPGFHVTRISMSSGSGRQGGSGVPNPLDAILPMFFGPPNMRGGADRQDRGGRNHPFIPFGPPFDIGEGPRSPLQEGPNRHGFMTGSFHTTTRIFPRDPSLPGDSDPSDDLSGILSQLIQGINGTMLNSPSGTPAANLGPISFIHQMLNPANARAGDAVYTQEALDRVISQLMEQHSTSSAPGPATETAINALPKTRIRKDHLDSNGKAECSICMENVSVGDEMTELPCKHWFHDVCVGAWLREHDTCPQCRRGIMPKHGDGRTPRETGQPPRHMQTQSSWGSDYLNRADSWGHEETSGRRHSPDRPTPGPSRRPSSASRRSSQQSGPGRERARTTGGGISGWMGRHFGGGSR
jgi:E3 ubiquitin-protein ligase RNF115/126